jgi:hypothetical protein
MEILLGFALAAGVFPGGHPAVKAPGKLFTVEVVQFGTSVHDPLPFSMTLDSYGRFHEPEGRIVMDDDLPQLMRSALCIYGGKRVVDLELLDVKHTPLQALIEAIRKLRRSADPARETAVYIYTSSGK